ncbi:hypothetical protein AN958_10661 [Leucoagaricus sp. SymC.cos]|nr:hypothetical protein AN958_10661 [Leucoagaricus sp. SymC.cos]
MKPEGILPVQAPPPVVYHQWPHRRHVFRTLTLVLLLQLPFAFFYFQQYCFRSARLRTVVRLDVLAYRLNLTDRCKTLRAPAGPPPDFDPATRVQGHSDRFVPGTHPVLIRNAKIWTGHDDGKEVVHGDVLLDRGLVVEVGKVSKKDLDGLKHIKVVDAKGRWVTPGLVDLHSHIGVDSAPHLDGAADTNSRKAPILPWLRSIDGINTHDQAFELTVSGGVTTVQVLPGSADNIGGQAFVIKLRPTDEKSTISKVVEPPQTLIKPSENVTHIHWRHMKHACGENPDRVYSQVRMDAAWNFRQAYHTANQIKLAQDAFCDAVEAGDWENVDGKDIPVDYQWESLVDVLRGKVRLSIHCYEAVDLDMIVRLSNEFQFHVTSFHHGGDTHLVPTLLKKTFGGPPTIALFASNARKKREAYRNSEFAPRILTSHGIPVSDHPVLNSRYLLFEAQQAHYYGLSTELALASVTTTPAKAAGLSHRVGFLSKGYDADVIVWDSHPLVLGATPTQVFIDGIPQLKDPHVLHKPHILQRPPLTPNFDRDARETVEFDGLPPLRPHRQRRFKDGEVVKLSNVSSVWLGGDEGIKGEGVLGEGQKDVYIRNGSIICITSLSSGCLSSLDLDSKGLEEIMMEASTNDGNVPDALTGSVPSIVGGTDAVIRAVDGLAFNGRNLLHAYRNGITKAITAPTGDGFIQGLSTEIFPGAETSLDHHAIIREEAAIHVTFGHTVDQSISTQVSALRALLFESEASVWKRVRNREIPLVINVDSADIMSTLIRLKESYKRQTRDDFDLTFVGASEAHLIAHEIAKEGISVVITMPRPYPGSWESQRILPGAPLTHDGNVMKVLHAGVNVGIGVVDGYNARNTRFEAAWLALNSFGEIGPWKALALVTINLERALGGARRHGRKVDGTVADLVVYEGGGWMDFESRVVGVVSSEREITDLF